MREAVLSCYHGDKRLLREVAVQDAQGREAVHPGGQATRHDLRVLDVANAAEDQGEDRRPGDCVQRVRRGFVLLEEPRVGHSQLLAGRLPLRGGYGRQLQALQTRQAIQEGGEMGGVRGLLQAQLEDGEVWVRGAGEVESAEAGNFEFDQVCRAGQRCLQAA